MAVNPNNTTVNLDTTEEEREVLDLDQMLTLEPTVTLEEREEDTTTRARNSEGGGEGQDGEGHGQEDLKLYQ